VLRGGGKNHVLKRGDEPVREATWGDSRLLVATGRVRNSKENRCAREGYEGASVAKEKEGYYVETGKPVGEVEWAV